MWKDFNGFRVCSYEFACDFTTLGIIWLEYYPTIDVSVISIDLVFSIINQITTMTSRLAHTRFDPKGNCTWRNLRLQLVSLHYHGSLAILIYIYIVYNMMIIMLLFSTKYFFGRALIIRRTFDTQRLKLCDW